MRGAIRFAGSILLATVVAPVLVAQDRSLAVNHVIVSDKLHTAGQPGEQQLATLGAQGFDLVVNLAPPTSRGAIGNEGELVARGGAAYVNIPVDWQNPTDADFDFFSAIMSSAGDRRVLVHCQMNMRASVFTFLYRVVHQQIALDEALSDLREVWEPQEQWARFTNRTLQSHGLEAHF